MGIFLLRRVLISLLTLWVITFVVYALIRNMPGDPTKTEEMDPRQRATREYFERLEAEYGIDSPWYVGYWTWLGNAVQGNLGQSFYYKEDVSEVIGRMIPRTLWLSGSSVVLAYLLSIPLGLYATARRNTLDERGMSVVLYMLYSVPSFVAGVFLQVFLAVRLGWLPLAGVTSDNFENMTQWQQMLDLFAHAIMPVACLTYGSLAYYSRFVRSNMVEVLQQDYIRTARAKGVSPGRVLIRHAFRNTLIPMITLMALSLPAILSGAVIIEQIFNWQGMGWLLLFSLGKRDYAVMMGLILMFSVLTLLGQLLADVLYSLADPRVNLD